MQHDPPLPGQQKLPHAGNSRVNAAYLVDPMDNTKYSPEGEEYPSGVKALKRVGKPVGITGAGIMGRCNPEGSNYKVSLL